MNNNETTRSYVIGFVFALILTFAAYFVVVNQVFKGEFLVAAIIGLALLQLIVQLVFFLHLGQEPKPRWNLAILLATVSIILIIVMGSLWIMNNLNYRHTNSPTDTNNRIFKDEGINK